MSRSRRTIIRAESAASLAVQPSSRARSWGSASPPTMSRRPRDSSVICRRIPAWRSSWSPTSRRRRLQSPALARAHTDEGDGCPSADAAAAESRVCHVARWVCSRSRVSTRGWCGERPASSRVGSTRFFRSLAQQRRYGSDRRAAGGNRRGRPARPRCHSRSRAVSPTPKTRWSPTSCFDRRRSRAKSPWLGRAIVRSAPGSAALARHTRQTCRHILRLPTDDREGPARGTAVPATVNEELEEPSRQLSTFRWSSSTPRDACGGSHHRRGGW